MDTVITEETSTLDPAENGEVDDLPPTPKRTENSDHADSESDEVVEIELKQTMKRSVFINSQLIETCIVKCSACAKQINHLDDAQVKKHPVLGVLLCGICYEFYGDGEFSEDEDSFKYCRWCAQGGTMFACDYCKNVFCINCIRRNFGRAETDKIENTKWKCYVCNPLSMKLKIAFCNTIIDYAKRNSKKDKKRKKLKDSIALDNLLITIRNPDVVDPNEWQDAVISSLIIRSKKFLQRLERVKSDRVLKNQTVKKTVEDVTRIADNFRKHLKNLVEAQIEKCDLYTKNKLRSYRPAEKDSLGNQIRKTKCAIRKKGNFKFCSKEVESPINTPSMSNEDIHMKDSCLVTEHQGPPNRISKLEIHDPISNIDKANSLGKGSQAESIGDKTSNKTQEIVTLDDDDMEAIDKNSSNQPIKLDDSDSILTKNAKTDPLFDIENNETQAINESCTNLNQIEIENDSLGKNGDWEVTVDRNKATKEPVPEVVPSLTKLRQKNGNKSSSGSQSSADDSEHSENVESIAKFLSFQDTKVKKISSDLSDSVGSSDSQVTVKRCEKNRLVQCFTADEIAQWNIDKEKLLKEDVKLKAKPVVELVHLKFLNSLNSEKSDSQDQISLSSDELNDTEKIQREVENLLETDSKSQTTKRKKLWKSSALKERKKTRLLSSSDALSVASISSSEDESHSDRISNFLNVGAKKASDDFIPKKLSSSSDDSGSISSPESVYDADSDFDVKMHTKMKKDKPKENKNGNSISVIDISDEDDFQPPKKKRHAEDKLLEKSLKFDDKKKAQSTKEKGVDVKEKRKKKRKVIQSDSSAEQSNSSDSSSTSSDIKKTKSKQQNKRRRIKVLASSDEDAGKEDKEKDETPSKGRKNIRKVLSDKKVTKTTREAQEEESERKKRIQARQKLYNQIIEKGDGTEIITRKLVLETDPESKEEVVEINLDIIDKLKPHQINGVKFMWESTIESVKDLKTKPGSGCILAHCMGLGKTLQVIAFLQTVMSNEHTKKKLKTALIICPYNTVLNWIKEFDYWLDGVYDAVTTYDMSSIKNNYDRRDCLKNWMDEGGVMVLGYNMFQRLVDGKLGKVGKNLKNIITSLLTDPGPDIVVCDEGHLLKNQASILAKSTNKLKTSRRIVLTGTPLQNNLKEYYTMMNFVKPNLLGTYKEFLNRFVNPISNGQYDNSSKHDVKLMQKRVHILHKLLEGCVQRCDYSALCKFLPQKHEYVISVKLSDVQINLYRYYLEHFARGQAPKADGCSLFKDYSALRNIWSFPYQLQRSFEKNQHKKMFKESDGEGSSYEGSFIDDRSTDHLTTDEENELDNLSLSSKSSTSKQKARSTRSRKRGQCTSSEDEIINTYTRSAADEDIGDEELLEHPKQWFHEFMSKDDKFKFEMSGKMVLLLDILNMCQKIGDKILVFSQSLLTLDMIEDALEYINSQTDLDATDENGDTIASWVKHIDYFRIDGSINVDLRKQWIDKFNNPENYRARLFLISTRAGSLGTNLVGANRVIILDASWNPSHDVQAIFRVYRFGQTKPVYVYRFLAQGTMEEKIYDRQVTKLSMSCRVIDEQQIDRHFNASDLAELYAFNPDSRTERPTPMVPKDRLLADLLISSGNWIVTYHEHDSLLQSSTEDDLTEEERQAAWTEYENEKDGNLNSGAELNMAYDLPNVEIEIRNIRMKLMNRRLPHIDFVKQYSFELEQLRARFQSFHVYALRQKQEYVSKQASVPQLLNIFQSEVQDALRLVEQHTVENNKILYGAQFSGANFQNIHAHRQPFVNAPRQPFVNAPRGGKQFGPIRFVGISSNAKVFPPNMGTFFMSNQQRQQPAPQPQAKQPLSTLEIIDITSENDLTVLSSNATPIVTEVEESEEPKISSRKVTVEITEMK